MWIWTWVGFLISSVILLIGYELVLLPNALKSKVNQSLYTNFTPKISPAKRIVFFMVDSMRDDHANIKWTTKIVENTGRGVVVSARSMNRPGLVSIFSGHYEDLLTSFNLRGRKTGKDNIFLYVDNTYYFGPEATLYYFNGSDKWISYTYPSTWLDVKARQDYADDYVMDGIQDLFNDSESKKMSQKNIFFIQLTSIDLLGQASRQGTDHLDRGVSKIGRLIKRAIDQFESYYNDSATTYIINSDHGMTNWGTHGSSLPEETRTPFIIWGSGIATGFHTTIRQVDICPLLSAILGVPVPAESIGILTKSYLNTTKNNLAYASLCNAVELAELCQTTWQHIEHGFLIKHVLRRSMTKCLYERDLKNIKNLVELENYTALLKAADNLTENSLQCITNIQNFYKASFLFIMLMSFFAWIFGTLSMLSLNKRYKRGTCFGKVFIVLTCLGYLTMNIVSIGSVIFEQLPYYYIAFFIVPSFAWMLTSMKTSHCLTQFIKMNQFKAFLFMLATLAMAELTYWAKYYPYLFSFFFVPYASYMGVISKNFVPSHVTYIWLMSSLALLLAPLFPLLGMPESPIMLNVASALWLAGSCFYSYALNLKAKDCLLTISMALIIVLATWIIDLTYMGSNLILKISAWVVLLMPSFAFGGSNNLAERLLQINIAMVGPYLLLSVRQEPLVLLVLTLNLYSWLRMESSSPQHEDQMFIRGLILHFYIVLGIFTTGNLPYISSFDVIWTRLFLTTFDDFLIGCLIIYKVSILLIMIVCFFCATCYYIGYEAKQMLFIAILTSAISTARHTFTIILSNDPVSGLGEFILGNALYLIIILPITVAPLLTQIKHIK